MKKVILFTLAMTTCILAGMRTYAQSYIPEWKESRMKVPLQVPIKAYAFKLSDVRLLPGPFYEAMKADEQYLRSIDADRLLSEFRVHAGLKAKAPKYGGWEDSGLAGHTLGHYLSAISMLYASTGDIDFLNRSTYIVTELAACQQARKTGYMGAIPREDSLWNEVKAGVIKSRGFDLNGAWSPWYTVHKIFAGLLDAYLYCGNGKALELAEGLADWTGTIVGGLTEAQMQEMLLCEYGGMNDALVNLYAITGKDKYLDLSYRFYDKKILDPLAAGEDKLAGKHSNTQIPKVIGSARRYELTKDLKDQRIADFFWKTVTKNHSYANGGNSNYEYLGEPRKLNDKLTDNTTESCNTYNMLKLTRLLFALNPSAQLMDYYEKALYNHILASQNHQDGMMCYFVSLRMGGRKEFSDPFNTFTCCVGSGMENHVKYNESIYYRGNDGSLYVNLFIPSTLNWKEKDVTIKQEGNIPADSAVLLSINTRRAIQFPLKIRNPSWAKSYTLKLNGKTIKSTQNTDGYIEINQKWKNNDQITFIPRADIYTESMPDNPNRKAVFYGPVLLAGSLGKKEPEVASIPVFVTKETNPNTWLRREHTPGLSFKTVDLARPSELSLRPFNEFSEEYYTVYWDVFSPETWATQQKVYEEERVKRKELEEKTTDILRIGEMQPERDHDLKSEGSKTGEDHNRKYRIVDDKGYMSFNMKVSAEGKNTLILSYWGMDNRGRTFDIMIDDKLVATEDLNKYKSSRFYDISYPLPEPLTQGKQTVVVTFRPKPSNNAGPVYGVRMIKEKR